MMRELAPPFLPRPSDRAGSSTRTLLPGLALGLMLTGTAYLPPAQAETSEPDSSMAIAVAANAASLSPSSAIATSPVTPKVASLPAAPVPLAAASEAAAEPSFPASQPDAENRMPTVIGAETQPAAESLPLAIDLAHRPSDRAVSLVEPTETAEAATASTETAELPMAAPPPLQNYQPLVQYQAAAILQDDEFSGRLRTTAIYAVSEQVLFGATVDLTTGNTFADSREEGLSLNELYVSAAPLDSLPNLRLVAGLLDLTSYFDRNSFAKDGATHFFNPVFQTNPALSAAGIATRPGLLVNWSATDQVEFKAAVFSSTRDLGEFDLDGFATEMGFRAQNLILRGTFATARDAGSADGFSEIFQFDRGSAFGLLEDDREIAYGLNAEYFIESLNLGLFGRYGWYENTDLGRDGRSFSLGLSALDVFSERDRLGLAYGQALSNDAARRGKTPDVWELFYDAPLVSGLRAGVSLQSRAELSETVLGLRLRADW